MTTQELRQSIDKVLGNSIRCLLPSYWWKRLFNQVADRIDEAEQFASELIETKVNEVKMPIVGSENALKKLELAKGRVAAVEKTGESATVKISDCYLSTNSEEDWGKYTIVKGVEEKDNVIIDKDTSVFFTASKGMVTKDAIQVNTISSGIFYYTKWTDDEAYVTSLEEVNKALSSGKYRAVQCLNAPDDYFTFYSKKSQPSLYIKGDSWTRLLKEGDVTGGDSKSVLFYMPLNDGLSDIQKQTNAESYKKIVDGFKNNVYYNVKVFGLYVVIDATVVGNALLTEGRIALMFDMLNTWQVMEVLEDGSATVEEVDARKGCEIREFYIGDSLTDQQKAWNLETAMMVEEKKCTTVFKVNAPINILPAGTTIPLSAFVDRTFLYVFSSGVNAAFVSVTIDSDGNSDITAESVSTDNALSSTSTNAVQNKVVTSALNAKADKTYVDNAIASAITTTLNTEV